MNLDLYDVVVHGTESDPGRPLFQVDHLHVGLTIDSLLNKEWHIRNIVVDRPIVRMAIDKAGENNLPKPPKKNTSSNTNVFNLAIRELRLNQGEIYYNDQKTPLDADLHAFTASANYDPAQKKYSGELGYNNGKIVYGDYAPMEHTLQAKFGVTPQIFTLEKLELNTGKSRLSLSATVHDYTSPNMQVQGNYEAALVTSDFQRVLKNPSVPKGTVRLTGQVKYQADPKRSLMETVSVAGNVSSSALAVKIPALQTEIRDLYARYQLSGGNAEVSDIRARVMGGTVSGKVTIRDVAGASDARLQASVKDLSLDQAQTDTHNDSLRQAHLSGKISADANARWAKTLDNLTAHSDATIKGSLGQGRSTPVDGAIHADYAAARHQLELTQSYIRTPQTTVNLNGKVSDKSQLQIALRSNDLHELEILATALQTAAPSQNHGKQPEPLGLYGTANMTASVSGSLKTPQIIGQMDARNLRVKGSSWKVLRTNFTANPSRVTLSNGDLEAVPQGHISFSAQANLKQWAYTPSSPITANLSASQISIADLEKLTNTSYPASGTLAVNVAVHGTQLSPVGQGTITVTKAKIAGESVQNLNVKFQGDGNTVNANLTAQMPAGTARANVDYYPKSQEYRAQVQAQNFRLEKLQTVQARNMKIAGALNLNASGHGTVKDPQLQVALEIPQLQMKRQIIQGIKLQTTIQNHVANITLDSDVGKTFVKAHGTVGIDAPYVADVRLDTGTIEFQPLVAIYNPEQAADVSGQTQIHATIRGPLAEKSRVEAHLEIPNLAFNYKQFQFASEKPIQVDYQNGTATLQPASIRGTGTTIDAQAVVPVNNLNAATFLVQGKVDLRIAQLFVPNLQSTGEVQFDIDSRRAGGNPSGQIKIVNANLRTPDSPLGLENGNGVINVTQTRLEISNLEGQVGGGTISATGAVTYRPAVQFHLGLAANNVRLRYPDGVRAILASNLTFTGDRQASQLGGQVKIGRVSFTPDFDPTTFVGQFDTESVDSGTPGSFLEGIKLDVGVQSTSEMSLESSQVSARGNANLRVAGTAAVPVILGRANLTGGEFFFAGNRYEVQQGTIDFLNPVRTEPVVNVQLRTTINQYNISLTLNGPIDRLQTTYTSDPALPPVDIIRLVATGTTQTAANAAPNTPATLGAESALASQISGEVSGKIARLTGVSQLEISPGLRSDNGRNGGPRIAIQQRVTSNLLVTFATDVTSTSRQALEVEYKFNRRWSVSGARDQNGGFGVSGKYRKDF